MIATRPLRLALIATALAPCLAAASTQQPSNAQWESRALPDGGAIALIGGPGALKTFSLICRGGTPTAVVVLADGQPKTQPASLGLSFGVVRVDLALKRDDGAGNVWYSDLRNSPLSKLLASQRGKATVSLNGEAQGNLNLQGSTRASQAALARCKGA